MYYDPFVLRTVDPIVINSAIKSYAETLTGLDVNEWVLNENNVALCNEVGDVALFERQWRLPDSVCGHYFFHSRGKEARDNAKRFLIEIFTGPYNVNTIIGLTPNENKAAMWMTRHLGFQFHGEIETESGPCQFAILTKEEWSRKEGITNE